MKRAASACRNGRCPGLVRNGVCSVCGPLRRQSQQAQDERRGSAARRGYDGRWQRIRALHLSAHPLCADCTDAGRVVEATEVHHRIALRNGGTHDESNLLSLCKSCHSTRTARGE